MEFCKQDPSIKGKFNADIDSIEQLLKEFHNKQLDVSLLERMSADFNLDYQKMLIAQVRIIKQIYNFFLGFLFQRRQVDYVDLLEGDR